MRRRTFVLLIIVGVILFVFFVPVVPNGGRIWINCRPGSLCPALGFIHYYSSLSYTYLGSGAVSNGGYYFLRLWETSYYP